MKSSRGLTMMFTSAGISNEQDMVPTENAMTKTELNIHCFSSGLMLADSDMFIRYFSVSWFI